ncbi:MAG: hypothetical protein ACOC5G_04075 [Acidobacteriota bacterium]
MQELRIKNWKDYLVDDPEARRNTIKEIKENWCDKKGNLILIDETGDYRDRFVELSLEWGFNDEFIEKFL